MEVENILSRLKVREPKKTLVSLVRGTSESIQNGRSIHFILGSTMSELGELAEEVNIEYSDSSYKNPGKDGVVGEAIDTIICLLDLIYAVNPELTEEEICNIASTKLEKWKSSVNKKMEEENGTVG